MASSKAGTTLQGLERQLEQAILPGDAPFDTASLTEAATALLSAAERREPKRSSLLLQSATGERRHLRLAIVNDDMPFLVDSIAATLAAEGLTIDRLVHPVVSVKRSDDGELIELCDKSDSDASRESMIYIETPRIDAKERKQLTARLRETLGDVRAAVSDWPDMRSKMHSDAERISDPENRALLEWLGEGMLTQLGHVTRTRNGEQSAPLGICRKSSPELLAPSSFERAFAWFDVDPKREVLVVKANHVSNVHRRVPLDLFIVGHRETADAPVTTLSVHAGVWTSAALASPPANVPILRSNLDALTQELGFDPAGHAGKALVHAFTALPHDLLIGFERKSIAQIATTMMSLVDRPRPRLALIESGLKRHIYAFVWLPRDLISTQLRLQVQDMLTEARGAKLLDWSLEVEGGNLAMLQFVIDVRNADEIDTIESLELRLEEMLRGWGDAVEKRLAETDEPARAALVANKYAPAFPPEYRSRYGADEAAMDIHRLRALASHGGERRDARLYRLPQDAPERLRLKVYQVGGHLPLSDAVPELENFGFRVMNEIETSLDGGALGTIHDFSLALSGEEDPVDVLSRAEQVERAISEVLNDEAEDDPFNRLVTTAGLSAEEANWLRAVYRYLRQTGMGFTIYTVVDALAGATTATRALLDLFAIRHNPGYDGKREEAASAAQSAFTRALTRVSAINDDRLLRLYHGVVTAVLRTNAFADAAQEALAFKLDSSKVPGLPKPLPWREIFVYSRRVEGIHLRAGAVARGGLRWSDRRDDFRTEILGLMKAQRVKNAVIVPSGAKGGFYPKQLPSPAKDREGWAAEGQASYEIFIRTLLSITDNIVDDAVIHPEGVVVHDGEDPYFVVAADKGTAKFSDVANAIALERGFWLGDAFASGGSNGYDHKAMGITAKGAWVSVQRHFLEMGIDVQKDSVTVAGCGDMSGDVFGNGMLLSQAIKLVAAFDHRNIFIDPDPDPKTSWKERKRMFDLPRSSWEDYNSKLISKGGGIYSRGAKSIKLSKTACDMLDLENAEIEPEKLIHKIITAQIDLLWFGGIGTYIKAEHENDANVGDPANDAVRAIAADVRAKVVGEGANLGVTQAGRIAFATNGGRINTDFIDNSAGVDCSDNEVNIKIALAAARQAGKLSEAKRNTLLESMTDDVSEIVLEDNRLQALALSIAEAGGGAALPSQVRLIETLEEGGNLDRRTEGLADNETLSRRASEGTGLTRPELAVLLSSAKLVLQEAIEKSALSSDPEMEANLIAMFPEAMRSKFKAQITGHQLRRQMVATELANRIVNRLGILPAFELAEEEGASLSSVAHAFVAANHLFEADDLWRGIDNAKMPETMRIKLFESAAIGLRGHMADLLRAGVHNRPPEALAEELRPGIEELIGSADELLGAESRLQSAKMRAELTEGGTPDALARRIANLFEMDGAVGLATLSRDAKVSAVDLTRGFTTLGTKLGLDWAQATAALMKPSDVWERLLVATLARDFQQMRLDFLGKIVRTKAGKGDPAAAIEKWSGDQSGAVKQFKAMITRAQNQTLVTPAVLAQIASQARNLLEK